MIEWFLADRASPALQGFAFIAAVAAIALGSVTRTRALMATNQIAAMFWRDATVIAWTWAGATAITLGGSVAAIDGLRMPMWLMFDLAVGIGLLVILASRLRADLADLVDLDELLGRDRIGSRRLESTTWEAGIVGAFVGGLGLYAVTLTHIHGIPIHWVLAGTGAALGYALAAMIKTPRYRTRGSR